MPDDKKGLPSLGNLAAGGFRASMLVLGAVITLNVAVAFMKPLLPWITGGIAAAFVVWLAVAIVRRRRSHW